MTKLKNSNNPVLELRSISLFPSVDLKSSARLNIWVRICYICRVPIFQISLPDLSKKKPFRKVSWCFSIPIYYSLFHIVQILGYFEHLRYRFGVHSKLCFTPFRNSKDVVCKKSYSTGNYFLFSILPYNCNITDIHQKGCPNSQKSSKSELLFSRKDENRSTFDEKS